MRIFVEGYANWNGGRWTRMLVGNRYKMLGARSATASLYGRRSLLALRTKEIYCLQGTRYYNISSFLYKKRTFFAKAVFVFAYHFVLLLNLGWLIAHSFHFWAHACGVRAYVYIDAMRNSVHCCPHSSSPLPFSSTYVFAGFCCRAHKTGKHDYFLSYRVATEKGILAFSLILIFSVTFLFFDTWRYCQ